jgi:hypothetical protein
MSDNQAGTPAKKRFTPRYTITWGAIATTLAIINLSVGGAAPSQPVLLLSYAFLALGLLGLAGGRAMI